MENISKVVVAQDFGRRIGYVLDLAIDFDNMKKIGYFVVDEESEGEFFLDNSDILKISSGYVFVASASKLQFSMERNSAFGKMILDENGNDLGCVRGFSFKGQRCEKFLTDRCEVPARYVTKVGQDFIFLHFGRRKSEKKDKIFEKFEKNDVIVSIQDAKISRPIEIEKVMLSADFYLGKVALQDVFGYNNEKIASKGQVVTKNVVAKARQHNKLNQLFFALKREK